MTRVHRRRILLAAALSLSALAGWRRWGGRVAFWRHADRFVVPDKRRPAAYRTPGHLRVLFIGNSFTSFFGGQALIGETLAARATPPPMFEQCSIFGATLKDHWEHSDAAARIREGEWDVVVLQDHSESTLKTPEAFAQYVRLFDAEVRKVGAKTVLFETWPKSYEPANGPVIAAAYESLAGELGGDVVPVGRAFAAALLERPALALYDAGDGKHATAAGSYLAACCFYAYLYRSSPVGLPAVVRDELGKTWVDLSADDARFLQRIAQSVTAKATTRRTP